MWGQIRLVVVLTVLVNTAWFATTGLTTDCSYVFFLLSNLIVFVFLVSLHASGNLAEKKLLTDDNNNDNCNDKYVKDRAQTHKTQKSLCDKVPKIQQLD